MKGWQIFLHSVRQVTGNFEAALKVSLIPMLIQSAVSLMLLGGSVRMDQNGMMDRPGMMAGFGAAALVVMVVVVVTSIWMAVNWHRYVLLGEAPTGYVPAFPGDKIKAYFLRSLGIIGVMVLAMLALGAVGGAIAAGVYRIGGQVPALIVMAVIVWLPLTLVGFRLSAALPGAALGASSEFLSGWNATKEANGDILVLAVISVVANLAVAWIGSLLSGIPVLGVGIGFLTEWLVTLVGLSILTTLYGHYVEGRALS